MKINSTPATSPSRSAFPGALAFIAVCTLLVYGCKKFDDLPKKEVTVELIAEGAGIAAGRYRIAG